ncbi:MAG: hypothetical protein ACOYN0_03785 [Phycisphaerales bacterium]
MVLRARRAFHLRMKPPDAGEENKGIARSLGEFFGHIWQGVKADPRKPLRRESTETHERETPAGKVILRRTIIEEVELPPDQKTP